MRTEPNLIECAVTALKRGEIIAYPTEAVYGLGCDPFNEDAVNQLIALKHRPYDAGLILVARNWAQVAPLIKPITPQQKAQVDATWPGAVTWVFPASEHVPNNISGKYNSVAIRVSAHPMIQTLTDSFGGPIVSTSANLSGFPPARDPRTLAMCFGSDISVVVEGALSGNTNPSEIRDVVTGDILRRS